MTRMSSLIKSIVTLFLALLTSSAHAGLEEGEAYVKAGEPVAAIQELYSLGEKGDQKAVRLLALSYLMLPTYQGISGGVLVRQLRWVYQQYKNGDDSVLMYLAGIATRPRIFDSADAELRPYLPSKEELETKLKALAARGDASAQAGLITFYTQQCGRECPYGGEIERLLDLLWDNPRPIRADGIFGSSGLSSSKYQNRLAYFQYADRYFAVVPVPRDKAFVATHTERMKDQGRLEQLAQEDLKAIASSDRVTAEQTSITHFNAWVVACAESSRPSPECEEIKADVEKNLQLAATNGSSKAKVELIVLRGQKGRNFEDNSVAELEQLGRELAQVPGVGLTYWQAQVDRVLRARKSPDQVVSDQLWIESAEAGDLRSMEQLTLIYRLRKQPNEAYKWCRILDRFQDVTVRHMAAPSKDACADYISMASKVTIDDATRNSTDTFVSNWRPKIKRGAVN